MQRNQSIRKSSKTMVIQLPQQIIPLKTQSAKKAIPTNLIRGLSETKKQQIKQPPPPPSPPKVIKVQPVPQIKEEKKQQLSAQAKLAKLQMKKWREMSESLQKKRQEEFHLLKKKLQLQRQKSQEARRKQLQARQELKRLEILKKQQLKKAKLKQQQKDQNKKDEKKQPLFQRKQKQFLMGQMAEEQKIKQNIMKKKQQMLIDMEQLKRHEEKFLMHIKGREQKVKKRRKSKSPTQGNQQGKHTQERQYRSEFNKFLTIDPQKKQKQLQKYMRRKKFEERVKRIPVKIDQEKMKQALIAKDKSQNPMKYNYLSNVAALSDQKIYEQFKDFEININKNELGNDYMRQMNGKILQASRLRSQSQSQLRMPQKKQYKNYLPQVKSLLKRKKIHNNEHEDQVQQIMDRYESQTDRVYVFNQKSQMYKNEALKKILQIKTNASSTGSYSDYLGKQQLIDDLYARSIKMKLASAQIAN